MSSGTTQLIAADQDDVASAVTNLGFDFFFQGVRYTQFSVNSNGILRLGSTSVGTTLYDPLAQAGQALIVAYGTDQRTHAGDGKVHYKLTGAAPNRILVVEWLNMQADFNAGGTAALTYQLRLTETTGAIEFVYGSMAMSAAGAADANSQSPQIGFSSGNTVNTIGTVTAAQSGSPDPSYNGSAASAVNNLYTAGTIPALNSSANGARRTFSFTPPTAADPTGLSFSGITPISITLNWTDNATNEIGYAIYRSTDGVTYSFISQIAAGSTSTVQTGLFESTTYYWKVFAVTEGMLSNALGGTQATSIAGAIASNGTGGGLWSASATWLGGVVPTTNDRVTIANGDQVSIDVAGNAYSLAVGQGTSGVLEFEATTARTLTVYTNVSILSGATFRSNETGTQTGHILAISGNLTNNGILDFSTNTETAGAAIQFAGAQNNTFGGTGTVTDIRNITINKGASYILELNPDNFSVRGSVIDNVVGGFLTLTSGTLKISGSFNYTGRTFSAAGYSIPAAGGFWLNNPNYTIAGQAGNATVAGLLKISQGTFNIGTATNNSIGFSAGSSITVEGGAVNSTGRFGVAAAGNAVTYTQTGGTITVCTIGNTSATLGAFDLGTSLSSAISMTNGTIICQLNSSAIDYRNQAGTGILAVTGGTLQLGNASSGSARTFNLRGVLPNVILTNTSANHNATMSTTLVNYNNIALNITNNGGTFNFGNTVFLFSGSTLTNNGTITHNGASSNFVWFGSSSVTTQTYAGTGTVTAAMTTMSIQSPVTSVVLNSTNQIIVNKVVMLSGGYTNANKLTLGNGAATTVDIQLGIAVPVLAVTGFDVAPVFNPGTGGVNLSYLPEFTGRTMGNEVPPSRTLNQLIISNPNTITIAGGDITTNTLTMNGGNINTDVNTLTLGSSVAATGTFTYTTGTIIGKFKRWVAAATGNLDFPVGTSSFKKNASVNFTTAPATGGTLTAEWVSSTGGNNGLPLTEGAINIRSSFPDGFWRVTAGDGLSGGLYTGTFTANGIIGVTDYAGLVLLKRSDASASWMLDGTHVTATGTNAAPVIARTGMSGFSEFAVAGDYLFNTLPVILSNFSAHRSEKVNLIQWHTAQEINTHHFILERSTDGRNFNALQQLPASGNNNGSYYSYTDLLPVKGMNYYRLRIVDADNSSTYSPVRMVRNGGIADIAIYPNPVKDVMKLVVYADVAGKGSVTLNSLNGHIIDQREINFKTGNNQLSIDMSKLAAGTYIVTVRIKDDIIINKISKY